ncbi:hypothetical protein [Enterococcus malodoratus]|uniref:LysR substrate-binding domain-containing protein n=1 Tax=Enterococcus malodoratus ATCC 43197 TaxID=1158601 RepID=R2QWG7_9ENTE|nr:hypothetical protein [Enterococcus malodoratus]EOH72806.1 hypothetical protein UAI_03690 [Enterococcus malodoratus ATCC 43197]EOT67354.1 hypothetical protein I585_02875 [Enterococcus malodoratus ATCC 43197]SPX03189.1 Uncharacterised protein [Enterococcus malodoratus]STD69394.1 Uncharacterised protein [Enterococcus malodoratus]
MKEEHIFWLKAKNNISPFEKNEILINRDSECPYRRVRLHYLEQIRVTDATLIKVDTLDVLMDMLESENTVAVIPEVILSSNTILRKLEGDGKIIGWICCCSFETLDKILRRQ